MIEIRLRTRISDAELEAKVGKVVTDEDYNLLLTRDARVLTPEGDLLCVYRRGAVAHAVDAATYDVLHSLRTHLTDNRGLASGTERITIEGQKRTRAARVASAIVGSFDANAMFPYCRLTAWTGRETEQFGALAPLLQAIAAEFAVQVPDRYAVQADYAEHTDPAWRIAGTPFTTVTVNNTYPTGVHTDKGDLEEGFSTLACVRRGEYTGGVLVFPRYRVAVDMRDGDLVMMNAHEWHGNTAIQPCDVLVPSDDPQLLGGDLRTDATAERISVVAYYRTDMRRCGTAEREATKRQDMEDRKAGVTGQVGLF